MNIYINKRIENQKRSYLSGQSEHVDIVEVERIREFTVKDLANFLYESYGKGTYYAVYNHRFTGRFVLLFYISVFGHNNFDLRPGGTIKQYCKVR
jgi:hypothetical protein